MIYLIIALVASLQVSGLSAHWQPGQEVWDGFDIPAEDKEAEPFGLIQVEPYGKTSKFAHALVELLGTTADKSYGKVTGRTSWLASSPCFFVAVMAQANTGGIPITECRRDVPPG